MSRDPERRFNGCLVSVVAPFCLFCSAHNTTFLDNPGRLWRDQSVRLPVTRLARRMSGLNADEAPTSRVKLHGFNSSCSSRPHKALQRSTSKASRFARFMISAWPDVHPQPFDHEFVGHGGSGSNIWLGMAMFLSEGAVNHCRSSELRTWEM